MSALLSSAEGGFIETLQVGLLALSALLLLLAAAWTRRPGAPLLALFAAVLAVGALREFTPDDVSPLTQYFDSRAARYHVAAILLISTVLIAFRDRRFPIKTHVLATRPLWLPIGVAVVLILIGGLIEEWAETMTAGDLLYMLDEMVEEALETAAYLLTLAATIRTLMSARSAPAANTGSDRGARRWRTESPPNHRASPSDGSPKNGS